MRRSGAIAALLALSLGVVAATAKEPGDPPQGVHIDPDARGEVQWIGERAGLRSYRDWSVACDSLGACTALNLSPQRVARMRGDDPGDHALPLLRLSRPREGAAWQIHVDYRGIDYAPPLAGLALHVMDDGREAVGTGYPLTMVVPGLYALDAEAVEPFLAESRRSRQAVVTMAGHGVHGLMSTSGLSASLIAMTVRQYRVDAEQLLRAEQRPSVFSPMTLDNGEARRLHLAICGIGALSADNRVVAARDQNGVTLIGLGCGGMSQGRRIWLVQHGDAPPTPAFFPRPDSARPSRSELILPLADFDMDRGEMTATGVMTGRGDCGWQRTWRWTGRAFELVETRIMPFCTGLSPASWFVVYRSS